MKVAVSVVTFSKNKELVEELAKHFPDYKLNTFERRYTKEEFTEALRDADAAIVGLDTIDEEVLRHCPQLKVIAKHGIGTDKVDFEACKNHGIEVKLQPGTNKRSVAELTLGFMLGLMRGAFVSSLDLKNGVWNKYDNAGRNLSEKTIGIIGVGNIGKDLVSLLEQFHCIILVNDIREDSEQKQFYQEHKLKESSKEEIYRQADIITIHTPLTELTRNMIAKEQFLMMKPASYFINTARGEIAKEEDLLWALKNNIIAGAGLDVYTQEPPSNPELLTLKNIYCTPHIGGTSKEASLALGMTAINNLREYFGT
ncbi:MAG: hydroxyacid dehydrogenase [Candidatus Wildermuthbacteria bacterium RIFCSPHIGHO2_02_FULL_49_9]|uniref:Hydroxyacid dehydrogenase n=2 Tax=Candidatus Wildermuthiibacteriota TaxID=1817923 RepID=A0A1G2R0W4_9BACT|nr:MAG: hydroxyacid dehydrogenase [Candidatus Wildermuthbacteria bacterium RIFCSPHIGHO2_01_FULL_49_22b]OHA70629.1 MAG: hydroxyacid dehydrogenase [Candidatus Wildermuthbacteria bacterium RIFCSPHIGHO2_02_FULL_49_9]